MPYKNLRRSAPSRTVPCALCNQDLRTDGKGVAEQVTGWLPNRDGGGANHVMVRRSHGNWAHVACLQADQNPVKANQGNLFG